MSHVPFTKAGRTAGGAALAILVAFSGAAALAQPAISARPDVAAQPAAGASSEAGRIAFDFPQAPPATIEIDLSEGILNDLAGIGEAAMSGVAEALMEARPSGGSDAVQRSVEHLAAVRQVVQTLGTVVRELHVRVYDPMPEVAQDVRARMIAHYQEKLREADWDNVVRVRDGNANVTLAVLRRDGAIRGVFVIISEGRDFVIANALCDLTPEKVKVVTHQITKIGLAYGLGREIERALRGLEPPRSRATRTELIGGGATVPERD